MDTIWSHKSEIALLNRHNLFIYRNFMSCHKRNGIVLSNEVKKNKSNKITQIEVYLIRFIKIRVKNFKSRGTIFLINLAVADIFKTLSNVPMNVVSSFYGEWLFGQQGELEMNLYLQKPSIKQV